MHFILGTFPLDNILQKIWWNKSPYLYYEYLSLISKNDLYSGDERKKCSGDERKKCDDEIKKQYFMVPFSQKVYEIGILCVS